MASRQGRHEAPKVTSSPILAHLVEDGPMPVLEAKVPEVAGLFGLAKARTMQDATEVASLLALMLRVSTTIEAALPVVVTRVFSSFGVASSSIVVEVTMVVAIVGGILASEVFGRPVVVNAVGSQEVSPSEVPVVAGRA